MTQSNAKIAGSLAAIATALLVVGAPLDDANAQAAKKKAPPKQTVLVQRGSPLAFMTQLSEGIFPLDLYRRMHMQTLFMRNLDALDVVDREMVAKALSTLSMKVESGKTSFVSSDSNIRADRAVGAADLFGENSVVLIIRDKAKDRTIYLTHKGSIGIQTGVKEAVPEMVSHLRGGQGFLSLATRGQLLNGDAIRVGALVPRFYDASYFGQPGSVVGFKAKEGAFTTLVARQLMASWPKAAGDVRKLREDMTVGRDVSLRGAGVKTSGLAPTFIDTNDAANMQIKDFLIVLPQMSGGDVSDLVAFFVASANTQDAQLRAFRAVRAALAEAVTKGQISAQDAPKVQALDEAKVMSIARGIHANYGAGFDREGFGLLFRSTVAFFQPDDDAVANDWQRAGVGMTQSVVATVNAGVLERVCTALGVSSLTGSRLCAYIATDRHNQSAIDAMVAIRTIDAMTYQLEKFQVGQDSASTVDNARADQNRFMREVIQSFHAIYLFANSEGQDAAEGWSIDYDRSVNRTKFVLEALRTRELLGFREGFDTASGKMMADLVGIFRTGNGIDFAGLEKYLAFASEQSGMADLKLLRHLVLVAQQKEQLGKGPSAPSVVELYGPNALKGQRTNLEQNVVNASVIGYVTNARKLLDAQIPSGVDADRYRAASKAILSAARLAAISKRGTVVLPLTLQAN